MEQPVRYLSFRDLQTKLGGRGRSSIYRDFGETGWLPRPIKIGGRLYWREDEVDAAISALVE
jgi:predicted DNA-binding transcriptional regulator AlpA